MSFRPPFLRKIGIWCVTLALGAVMGLHLAQPFAQAQTVEQLQGAIPPGGGAPVVITGNLYENVSKQIQGFFSTIQTAGLIAIMNAFQVFSQRIAYDAAQRILTGDAGQQPLFWEQGFGDYLASVAEDAGNQFISDINENLFKSVGFDLCEPIDKLQLQLSLSGLKPVQQLQAKCTAAQIGKAFELTKEAFNDSAEVFNTIKAQYDPSSSELGVGIRFYNKLIDAQVEAETAAALDRSETRGLKHVKDIISGNIRTPNQAIEDALKAGSPLQRQLETGQINALALTGNVFRIGLTQLGALTASTFISTLATGALDKLFTGLAGGAEVDIAEIDFANEQAVINNNASRARIVFSDLLTPNLYTSDQQDFINELSSCPTPRGLWGCAMDEAFATALRTVGETGAYTVAQAAHITSDGKPPTNPAFLRKDWELIPESEAKDNLDPSCYQRAYCTSNLAKLRYARILPVGWELAANSPYNKKRNGKYITLQEVVAGFHVCNDKGQADEKHPWCHLIDPNWILSAPSFQCKVKGYGDTLFPGTNLRLQECADAVSCLKQDDAGSCTGGYGYCMAEKPVWRFSGDICLERFASCRTYQSRSNQRVSFLRNTLDYGSCTADNVGCLWYATERDTANQSDTNWIGTATSGPRVYVDGTAKPCSAANDGCTRLLETQVGQSALNLVQNGSFEQSPANNEAALVGWTLTGAYTAPPEGAVQGTRSLSRQVADGLATSDRVEVAALRNYVFSLYVRPKDTNAASSFGATLKLLQANGSAVNTENVFRSAGCTFNPNSKDAVGFTSSTVTGEDWQRVECTFVTNPGSVQAYITIQGTNALVDAIQLEEGEVATAFTDGFASGLTETHLKLAPEEFACTGQKSDHPACAKYARVCRQTDVGCQGYSDVQNPQAPQIPATLSATDFCPSSCIGYAQYLKQPSAFDLGKSTDERLNDPQDDTAATFVPAYARQCTVQDLGCEEFTNLESIAQGGEEKSHYNYIQACEKPSQSTETYFTWEGSDTTGYQLRTWSLIRDSSVPVGLSAPPKIIQKAGPDGILKDPAACNKDAWQVGSDADCRQFFNGAGQDFYAYLSQTVISTPDCRAFRKNASNAADCGKTGGAFNPATNECTYNILSSQSRSCSAVAAGCRAYIGPTGRNTSLILQEDFRGSGSSTPFTAGQLSNESILVGDQSLKVAGGNPNELLQTSTVFPTFPNQLYTISFWAKTTKAAQPTVTLLVDGKIVGTMKLEVDWRRYEFGPFSASTTGATSTLSWVDLPNMTFLDQIRIERLSDVSYVVKDSWTIPQECDRTLEGLMEPQAMIGCRAYRDRDNRVVTLRRFGHLCREEAIGCKAFVDTRNSLSAYGQTFAIQGTTQLSKPAGTAAGQYEAMYTGTATTTRKADRYVYVIDDPKMRCDATQASCRAFGKPRFAQDRLGLASATGSFDTIYLIDDVTQYVDENGEPKMLCRKNELFCEEFKSGKTVAYFRDPGNHACVWRDKVALQANPSQGIPAKGDYSGWFRQGTDVPCYPALLSSGNTYLLQNAGDAGYVGWAANCPVDQSECTEFRDPNDTSDPIHPSGKPYFFIKNQRLDLTSCNGKVDLLSGCVLFRDFSDTNLSYSVKATYSKSAAEGDIPQSPIDCVNDPDNPYCAKAKVCTNVRLADCSGKGCEDIAAPSKSCLQPMFCSNGNLTAAEEAECLEAAKYCSGPDAVRKIMGVSCEMDSQCNVKEEAAITPGPGSPQSNSYVVEGNCAAVNTANAVMKVKLDRDCAQWLGCSSSETVYDSVQGKYVDVCTDVALCDASRGSNAGEFCANYVNRSKDAVLKPGVFFNQNVYTSRQIGFGQLDYSGYTIPDQFQAMDIQNQKVAADIFFKPSNQSLKNRFALDYRLAAAVPETATDANGELLLEFPANNGNLDTLHPDLRLCRHKQTGRTGYYVKTTSPRVCYFAVDALSARVGDILQNPNQAAGDPRNIQALADIFRQSKDPSNDVKLQQSFPPAECKAAPESDAPFSNLYVQEWDQTRDPAKPLTIVDGYGAANLCAFGEDCSCSYRKVKYGGQVVKYYSPFGIAPPAGICQGGSRDGQSCVPSENATQGPGGITTNFAVGEDPACPGGGRCMEISDVVLVRGQFGQCLQRDFSRTLAGDPGRHPCLIWNPTPILSSTYDVYHYTPTAGYLPPVNAGEYYCLSNANPPIEGTWTAKSRTHWNNSRQLLKDGENPYFYLPGSLSKFNYDLGYIAGRCPKTADICEKGAINEGSCNCQDGIVSESPSRDLEELLSQNVSFINQEKFLNQSTPAEIEKTLKEDPKTVNDLVRWQNLGQGIDGRSPNALETSQAGRCAQVIAWKQKEQLQSGELDAPGAEPFDIGSPQTDFDAGRWIQTGNGIGRTYLEYFVPVKPAGVAQWLYSVATSTNIDKFLAEAMDEKNFAAFQFFATGDQYAAACRLPTHYVDGVSINNYGDPNEVANASKQVLAAFNRDFDGKLDRSKEILVKNSQGQPIKEKCSGLNDGKPVDYADANGYCYLKAWETNYRLDGVSAFEWLNNESGSSFWDRHKRLYGHERTCSKSGFAIRAMFENTSKTQNSLAPTSDGIEQKLAGPYRFVGFWITACTAGTTDESFLYLNLRVTHADICRDIAQVVSPYTREVAAFADRVWSRGNFSIPLLGYNYGSGYTPFGSALVHGIPGLSPLFQTGGPVLDFSKLHPPTFLGSGQTYYTSQPTPVNRWAHLSNIFARVYRIYAYHDRPVSSDDYACVNIEKKGIWCPSPPTSGQADLAAWEKDIKRICGIDGFCDDRLLSRQAKNAVHRCNGLSGVNAGLECGSGFPLPSLDPVCHNAAMKRNPVTNALEPQLSACVPRGSWHVCDNGLYAPNANSCDNAVSAKTAYEKFNAFGCDANSVIDGSACSEPSEKSKDCPLEVTGITCVLENPPRGPMKGHCGGGYEHARCNVDSDCVFTAAQWWGAYDDGIPKDLSQFPLEAVNNNLSQGLVTKLQNEKQNSILSESEPRILGRVFPVGNDTDPIIASLPLSYGNGVSGNSQSSITRTILFDGVNAVFDYFVRHGRVSAVPNGSPLLQRWPSPHIAALSVDQAQNKAGQGNTLVVPGLCEGAVGAFQDPDRALELGQYVNGNFYPASPFSTLTFSDYSQPAYALQAGMCSGGLYAGQMCYTSSTNADPNWLGGNTCKPPAGKYTHLVDASASNLCKKVAVKNLDGSYTPASEANASNNGGIAYNCSAGGTGDPFSTDPALDNNDCTHPAGYYPRLDICQYSSQEKCLTGYDLAPATKQASLDQTASTMPTDVTPGFHTSIFLGQQNGNPQENLHIAHYAPMPPRIVAPDLSRTCQTPGACPISTIDGFALDDQTSGSVFYAGGQGEATLRFYGWAANEQTPLKGVYVDWGDGKMIKIEDARVKNKKPFCGTTRECALVPGLTCNTDSDCPAGGGKCIDRGTCLQSPQLTCSKDADCQVAGKAGDKCLIREFFGNSTNACEANYFEFTHAYACSPETLPACDDGNDAADTDKDDLADKHCSRNPSISCNTDDPASAKYFTKVCGAGDSCVAGLAQPGGCFDELKNACVFTPRVMLKDSWNWCTGECRAGIQVGNQLKDTDDSIVRHVYGGCWQGTETLKNTTGAFLMKDSSPITNECTLEASSKNIRPWIVYPGAVEVGTIK